MNIARKLHRDCSSRSWDVVVTRAVRSNNPSNLTLLIKADWQSTALRPTYCGQYIARNNTLFTCRDREQQLYKRLVQTSLLFLFFSDALSLRPLNGPKLSKVWHHTVLPSTRQRWESRLYPKPKQVLDLATTEGCKAELTYVTCWDVNRVPGTPGPEKNYPIPGFKLPESYPRVRFPTQKRQDCRHSRDSLGTVVY